MKKLVLTIALVFYCFSTYAQDSKFGVTAGFQSTSIKVSGGSFDISEDASGFFLGFYVKFIVSETFSIQPELQYSSVSSDGETLGLLVIPIMMKFHVSEKLNIMVGPQFDYVTAKDTEGIDKLGLGLGLGLGYDISDHIAVGTRYSFGFDRLNDMGEDIVNASIKLNVLQVGLSYRF